MTQLAPVKTSGNLAENLATLVTTMKAIRGGFTLPNFILAGLDKMASQIEDGKDTAAFKTGTETLRGGSALLAVFFRNSIIDLKTGEEVKPSRFTIELDRREYRDQYD